jgi:hypothetical protein
LLYDDEEGEREEEAIVLRFIHASLRSLLSVSVTSSVVFTKVKSPPSAIVLLTTILHVP